MKWEQSSRERAPEIVVMEMGRGGMETTSTSRERMPVRQILAPPSMNCRLSMASDAMAARMILTMEASSPWRQNMWGRPTTWVTLPRKPPEAVIRSCS